MKKTKLLMTMMALATTPLMGQTAQEIADSLTVPALKPGDTQLQIPQAAGATVTLGGADYKQVIGMDGLVQPVIADTPVHVFFKVTKDGEEAISKDYRVLVPAASKQGNAKPRVIPEILQWRGEQGFLELGNKDLKVYCEDASLADQLVAELRRIVPGKVELVADRSASPNIIFCSGLKERLGKEGYFMGVDKEAVTISAGTRTGLLWGSRTLMQLLRQNGGSIPCGQAMDFPRFALRGFMLDIARTHFTLAELREVVDLMAWYKMNDLHLVINNNYIFHENYVDKGRDPFKESYAAFRLESNVKGADGTPLTAKDVFYTKKEFLEFIDYAKARGVNVVPEIDTPGHALSFTRVRPDLIYQGKMRGHVKRRCEMLDASNDETIKFVGSVFDEYMLKDEKLGRPVFDGCVVHIGSDEFYGEAEDYRKYTDGLLRHVLSRGYTPRVWGSLSSKPGKTPVVAQGVQMNLWSSGWMKAWEAVKLGYDVINTNDGALYIVPFANYYRMDKNHKWVYNNFLPNKVGGETLPAGHPQLLGATFAVWNDMCGLRHPGYGMYDIWDIISSSMNVLSQRLWGKIRIPMSYEEYKKLASAIGGAPGSNISYALPGGSQDLHRVLHLDTATLPYTIGKPSIAPSYHLTMEVELAEAPEGQEQVLLSSQEGELLAVMKDGNIGFRRGDTMEFSWAAKLPVGKRVKLELIGEPGNTRLILDGQPVEKMTLNSYGSIDENFAPRTKGIISTFILPQDVVGKSFRGKIYTVDVNAHAPEEK